MTDARERDVVMTQYTVYKNPADYPGQFVVRPFDIVRGEPEPIARAEHWVCGSLEECRAILARGNPDLYCLARHPSDHESVVEVWI